MSALDVQVGGEHYKSAKIQPVQYIEANGIKFLEGCVIKRVTRHDKPTGKGRQDIEKAIHELQLLLELRYSPTEDDQMARVKANAAFAEALLAANSGEPAAQIDDESDRQKAVEQNGNDGAVYDDPWYGAPEWARFKAQDKDGSWCWYDARPVLLNDKWACKRGVSDSKWSDIKEHLEPVHNTNWRDTLIERP